jgi:hypothetical protein
MNAATEHPGRCSPARAYRRFTVPAVKLAVNPTTASRSGCGEQLLDRCRAHAIVDTEHADVHGVFVGADCSTLRIAGRRPVVGFAPEPAAGCHRVPRRATASGHLRGKHRRHANTSRARVQADTGAVQISQAVPQPRAPPF